MNVLNFLNRQMERWPFRTLCLAPFYLETYLVALLVLEQLTGVHMDLMLLDYKVVYAKLMATGLEQSRLVKWTVSVWTLENPIIQIMND